MMQAITPYESVIIDEPSCGQSSTLAATFIFAHGAGADKTHPFMQTIAKGLAAKGIRVVRFDFPYMVKRQQDGKRRPPDRAPKLLEAYTQVIEQFANQPLVIGGKSMGGVWRLYWLNTHRSALSPVSVFLFIHRVNPSATKGSI